MAESTEVQNAAPLPSEVIDKAFSAFDAGAEPKTAEPEAVSEPEAAPEPETTLEPEAVPEPESEPEPEANGPEAGTEEPTPEQEAALKAEDNELSSAYADHPELKDFLKKNPALRPAFFRAVQINKLFPGGVEDARAALTWMKDLAGRNRAYFDPNPESKRAFLRSLADQDRRPDGTSTGNYNALIRTAFEDAFDSLKEAVQSGKLTLPPGWEAKDLKIAVDGLSVLLGMKPLSAVLRNETSGAEPSAQALDELNKREQAITQREQGISAREKQNFLSSVTNQFGDWLGKQTVDLVGKVDAFKTQPTGFREWVKSTINARTMELLKQDETFTAQLEADLRSGSLNPGAISKKLEERARQYLPTVTRQVFREAGVQMQANQAAAEQKRESVPKRKEPARTAHGAPFSPRTKTAAAKAGEAGAGMRRNPGESFDAFASRVIGSQFGQ